MSSQAIALNGASIHYKQRERIVTKPTNAKQIIYWGVLSFTAASILYIMSVMVSGMVWLPIAQNMSAADLRLSLLECFLGIAVLHAPMLITKVCKIQIPDTLCSAFYLFIFGSTVLGELFSLYYAFTYWDVILHFSSGIMLSMFGAILMMNFLNKKKATNLISPMFIAVAAIAFALCVGVLWEFYEFSADMLLGMNMQKCVLSSGVALSGNAAVVDTMKDLFMDFFGGTVAAALTYRSLKQGKGWLVPYQTKKSEGIKTNENLMIPDKHAEQQVA